MGMNSPGAIIEAAISEWSSRGNSPFPTFVRGFDINFIPKSYYKFIIHDVNITY